MYVAPVDSAYIKEHHVFEMKVEYRKRFGKPFISLTMQILTEWEINAQRRFILKN